MKEYITTLIGSVIVCSLAAMLTPEDERGMTGYVRLAAGLCVLCVAVAPISSFLTSVLDFDAFEGVSFGNANDDGYREIYEESLKNASKASIEKGICGMLCRDFKLKDNEIDVGVELYEDDDGGKVKSVTVTFVGTGAFFTDPHEVISYINELLGCRCEIVYG